MSIWKYWENLLWSVQIFSMESCYGHKILVIHLTKLFDGYSPLTNTNVGSTGRFSQNMLGEFTFWSETRDIIFDALFQPNFEGNQWKQDVCHKVSSFADWEHRRSIVWFLIGWNRIWNLDIEQNKTKAKNDQKNGFVAI